MFAVLSVFYGAEYAPQSFLHSAFYDTPTPTSTYHSTPPQAQAQAPPLTTHLDAICSLMCQATSTTTTLARTRTRKLRRTGTGTGTGTRTQTRTRSRARVRIPDTSRTRIESYLKEHARAFLITLRQNGANTNTNMNTPTHNNTTRDIRRRHLIVTIMLKY